MGSNWRKFSLVHILRKIPSLADIGPAWGTHLQGIGPERSVANRQRGGRNAVRMGVGHALS